MSGLEQQRWQQCGMAAAAWQHWQHWQQLFAGLREEWTVLSTHLVALNL